MSEFDAFGRKKGDDPLTDLGWGTNQDPDRTPTPVPVDPSNATPPSPPSFEVGATPTQASPPAFTRMTTPSPASTPTVRAGGGIRMISWAVSLLIIGGVAFGVYAAADGTKEVSDRIRESIDSVTTTTGGGIIEHTPEESSTGDDGTKATGKPQKAQSLISAAGFAKGIKILRRDVPGKLQNFRVEGARIDIQVWLKGGKLQSAQLAAGAEAAQKFSVSGSGFPNAREVSWGAIKPKAMARFIEVANSKTGHSTKNINYLVFGKFGDSPQWSIYYKDGKYATGNAQGRFLQAY